MSKLTHAWIAITRSMCILSTSKQYKQTRGFESPHSWASFKVIIFNFYRRLRMLLNDRRNQSSRKILELRSMNQKTSTAQINAGLFAIIKICYKVNLNSLFSLIINEDDVKTPAFLAAFPLNVFFMYSYFRHFFGQITMVHNPQQ